jgi:hypothetical protein
MGTRSLTRVIETYNDNGKEKKDILVTMYRQYDGYASGHGMELAEFIKSGKVVNGLGIGNTQKQFNGAGCFAAQMISHFKGDSAGGFYIYPNSVKDAGQDYEYHVIIDYYTHEIKMICFEQGYINKTGSYVDKKRKLFEGTADEFIQFVKKEESTTP